MLKSYVSIDLETTGLNPKLDKIIEIGAVKVVEGKVVERFSTFVNPGRLLEEKIVLLTGITDENLKGAPSVAEVLPELMEFLGDFVLLGHSLLFDYSFLKKAAVNAGLSFERRGIDTLKIARKYLTCLEHRTLDFLCDYYQISHHAHRALADAEATHLLYEKLLESFYDSGDTLFIPQDLVFRVKKDAPATKMQKERLYRLADKHKLNLPMDIEKMTKSEASRVTDLLRLKGYR